MDSVPTDIEPWATTDDRRAAGHALRARLPRGAHAHWTVDPGRDPLPVLAAADRGRLPALMPLRHARMAADTFSFLRGSSAVMADDLAGLPSTGLLAQSCGDAHLMNFGGILSAEGVALFDVIDFDDTLPAPFEWDLKRLAVSLTVAGRAREMGPKLARSLARRAAYAYRQHIDAMASLDPIGAWRSRVDLDRALDEIGDRDVRRRERHRLANAQDACRAGYRHLVASGPRPHLLERQSVRRIEGQRPVAQAAFTAYASALPPDRLALFGRYQLRDVAFKAVGIGSLGAFCALGLFATADDDILLLQAKEARPSVLARPLGVGGHADDAERVVLGQRLMQASADVFLGCARPETGGRAFYVRQLRDPRLAATDTAIEAGSLRFYAQLCARALARAHARGGDAARISGYLGEGDSFDDAIAEFAWQYSEQVAADHTAFVAAYKAGRLDPGPAGDPGG